MASSFGTYALAEIAAQVMGRDARFGARASLPLLGHDEFTRFWKVDAHLSERVREFLDLYGDGDHYIPASPTAETHAITNPAADQDVSVPGLWRVVRNFEDPGEPGVVFQTLRRGFLRPPSVSLTLWGAAGGADGEARVWRVQQVAADVAAAFGTHYAVVYPHVDKTYVREFCAELIARGTVAAPVFDRQTALPGAYTFRAARNAEQEDGTSTVFAVLASTDVPPGLEVLIYDGCAAKEWVRFFWDLHTLPAVPPSTSGVEYRLQGASLDRETGLWTCTLAREETKTLAIPKHTVAEDLYARRERAVWQQVREGDKDHLGAAIPLETPGIATDGAVVDVNRSKNRNCTQDIAQDREHDLPVAAAETSETRTLFEHTVESQDKAQPAATDTTVPAASGGVIVRKSVRKTRGNQRDIGTRTDTEQPVAEAQKSETRTIFETRQSRLDKAQALATDLTAPAASGGVVTTKRGVKTPGALLDVTTDIDTEQPVSDAQKSETKTLFETRRSKLDKNQAADTDLTAPAASGGVVTTKRGAKTPGGLLDVTTDTDTEQAVSNAQKSETKTLFETRASKLDKNQAADTDLTAPAASGGVVTTKRGAKTPGNLLDVTTDTDTEHPVAAAQKSETKTLFETRQSTLDKAQAPGTDLAAPAASGGVVTTKRGAKTPGGLLDVTTDTDTEHPVAAAERTFRRRAHSTHTRVVDRSQAAAPADPATPGASQAVAKTPGNLVHVTRDTSTFEPFLNAYTVPGLSGAVYVKEFGFYTQAMFLALLASLGSASDWQVSPSYDEETGLWSGTIANRRRRSRQRQYWEEFYHTGITETETSVEHRNGEVWKVVTTYTYNLRAENDVDDLVTAYKAETARKNGSWIRPDYGSNRGAYKAVTDIKTQKSDITSDFLAGSEVAL